MKKLLTLMTLLLCVCSGAWGDTEYSSTPLISADFSSMSDGTPTAIGGVTYHNATIDSGKLKWGGNWSEGTRDIQITFTITGTACKLVLGHVTGNSMGIKGILYKGGTKVNDFTSSAWSLGNNTTSDDKEFTGLTAGTYTLKLGPGGQSARSVITSINIYDESSEPVLTWTIATNTSTLSSTQSSTITYVPKTNMTGISLEGLTTSDGAKAGLSAKVQAVASYSASKYSYVSFTVEDGYMFAPSSVTAVVQAVGTGVNQNCKMVLSDAKNSIESDVIVCPGTSAGSPTDVTISNDDKVKFTGTVTLKIYVYGNNATYRLGPTIRISGDVFKAVTIAANKEWITYCSTDALDFSDEIDGLEGAYTISAHTSGASTLTATSMTGAVEEGTGLLLHAKTVDAENPQVIYIPVAASGDEQTGNMLKGVTVATTVSPTDGIYTNLGLKNGAFVPYSASGTIAANKAYLQIPTADMPSADAKLTIVFGEEPSGEADGIKAVSTAVENGVRYNLAGQRVGNDYKGIVIVNGKKMLNK